MKFLAYVVPAIVVLVAGEAVRAAKKKSAVVREECIQAGQLAVTFDDGPAPGRTRRLLKTLSDYGVPATFFLNVKNVGDIVNPHSADADIVRETYDAGHVIASHTYSHLDLRELAENGRDDDIRNQLCWTDRAIARIIGKAPRLFRAPYGHVNKRVLQILAKYGYVVVGWNIDTRDYDKESTVHGVVSAYTDKLAHVRSGIALQHDIHERTVDKFVPAIFDAIAGLQKKWTYVTADVCVGENPYRADPWQGNNPRGEWYCPPMPGRK